MLFLGKEMRVADPAADPLAPIRRRFLIAVEDHSAEVDLLLSTAESAEEEHQSLIDIGLIAHRVSGVAATLGFQDLGRVAAELDQKIGMAGKSGRLALQEFQGMVALFVAALHDAQVKKST